MTYVQTPPTPSFSAPYVNYIQKDPGSPCSLTEALEYLQVDILEDLMEKDSAKASPNQPPKNKPHNLTVVAMEGCHSFIILDWALPVKDDMVSGMESAPQASLSLFLECSPVAVTSGPTTGCGHIPSSLQNTLKIKPHFRRSCQLQKFECILELAGLCFFSG